MPIVASADYVHVYMYFVLEVLKEIKENRRKTGK